VRHTQSRWVEIIQKKAETETKTKAGSTTHPILRVVLDVRHRGLLKHEFACVRAADGQVDILEFWPRLPRHIPLLHVGWPHMEFTVVRSSSAPLTRRAIDQRTDHPNEASDDSEKRAKRDEWLSRTHMLGTFGKIGTSIAPLLFSANRSSQ
jgi:hypothetical protein